MRVLLFTSITLSLSLTGSSGALACEVSPPYETSEFGLAPSGHVAQGALLSVDDIGGRSYDLELLDAQGNPVDLSATLETRVCEEGATRLHDSGQRCVYTPTPPLPPGTYTLRTRGPHATTFTVNDALRHTDPVPAPTVSWQVVNYTGPKDPPFNPDPFDLCGGISADPALAWHNIDARVDDPDAQGHFAFTLEDASGRRLEGASFTSRPAQATWLRDLEQPEDFIECVAVTFVDVYGRASEPTRQCVPNGCEVRDKNDRRDIDWADVNGCSDWSPGYAERNAPGCACAQAPGAPSGSPVALVLGLLGLVGLRRRGLNA